MEWVGPRNSTPPLHAIPVEQAGSRWTKYPPPAYNLPTGSRRKPALPVLQNSDSTS